MPKINIFVASHLRDLALLEETVKSTSLGKDFPTRIYISFSSDLEHESIAELLNKYDNLKYIKQKDKTSQIDHLKLLYLNFQDEIEDNEWVTFCDDDDMLLPSICDSYANDISDGFVGYQYIPQDINTDIVIEENMNVLNENVHNFINKYQDVMIKDLDFSGTSLRFKHLKIFFENFKPDPLYNIFGDLPIMDYVESLKNHSKNQENPIVFRRLKSEPSLWMKDLGNFLVDLNVKLEHNIQNNINF